jgi:hypothetical protein
MPYLPTNTVFCNYANRHIQGQSMINMLCDCLISNNCNTSGVVGSSHYSLSFRYTILYLLNIARVSAKSVNSNRIYLINFHGQMLVSKGNILSRNEYNIRREEPLKRHQACAKLYTPDRSFESLSNDGVRFLTESLHYFFYCNTVNATRILSFIF